MGSGASKRAYQRNAVFRKYTMGDRLGGGMCSQVVSASAKETGDAVAIKCVVKEEFIQMRSQEGTSIDFRMESAMLRELDHPNCCKLYESFEDELIYYIVLEPLSGSELFMMLESEIALKENDAVRICKEMITAVSYIHERGVIHRDIKPENWLFEDYSPDARVKLVDFGLATKCKVGESLTQPCGTLHYIAPEVLRGSYSFPSDIWALGVVIFLVLYGSYPFDGGSAVEVMQNILSGEPEWNANAMMLSNTAKDFIKLCLNKDPFTRITATPASLHRWFDVSDIDAQFRGSICPSSVPSCLAGGLSRDVSNASTLMGPAMSAMSSLATRGPPVAEADEFDGAFPAPFPGPTTGGQRMSALPPLPQLSTGLAPLGGAPKARERRPSTVILGGGGQSRRNSFQVTPQLLSSLITGGAAGGGAQINSVDQLQAELQQRLAQRCDSANSSVVGSANDVGFASGGFAATAQEPPSPISPARGFGATPLATPPSGNLGSGPTVSPKIGPQRPELEAVECLDTRQCDKADLPRPPSQPRHPCAVVSPELPLRPGQPLPPLRSNTDDPGIS